ncbi:MAG: hypothetical protein DRP41_02995 [Thermodesulfobacteriota bacterium]|nr:MAG: hypothetical protein DRP41_02995 [Thermodesulfobacteriota bacterium]
MRTSKIHDLLMNAEGKIGSKLLSLVILLLLLAFASIIFHFVQAGEETPKGKIVVKVNPVITPSVTPIIEERAPKPNPKKEEQKGAKEKKLEESFPQKREQGEPIKQTETPSAPREDIGFKREENKPGDKDGETRSKNLASKKGERRPLKSIKPNPVPPEHAKKEGITLSKKPIVLDKEQYREILRYWENLGNNEQVKGQDISVSVRNLRETYRFFGMKPVLIIKGDKEKLYDLTNSSSMLRQELKGYSDVVFECSEPLQDWAESLNKIGINESTEFKIYYYMFPWIKSSIFARARQSVEYARQKGLLNKTIEMSKIEVQGDTQVIEKKGGGKFGLFIPRLILTAKGETIRVNLDWFSREKDLQILSQNLQ